MTDGRVDVVTPEGVPIPFQVASFADRAGAFAVDLILQTLATAIAVLCLYWAGANVSGWQFAFVLLVAFLLRTFYFAWFEFRWQGRTPGKRRLKICVVDARGGPLTADAILARNFTRELEVWLPLAVLTVPEKIWPGVPGWVRILAGLWLLVIATLPLWNRRRQRVGDLIAGTLVVLTPAATLLDDVGVATGATSFFTIAQLDIYGIFELQVLEDILRKVRGGAPVETAQLAAVADKIKAKIGSPNAAWKAEPVAFLEDFYTALRARLEARMLLGKKKLDKYAR